MNTYKLRIPSLSLLWFTVRARWPWEAYEDVLWRIKNRSNTTSVDYNKPELWEMIRIVHNGRPDNTRIWEVRST